jgi:FixJ family two-component response regulator
MDHIEKKDAFLFIVAEDRGMREMLLALLKAEGFERVLTFSNRTDVLQMAEAVIPDVYIIDYECPGMTGLQLYQQLLAKDGYVPCIFLDAPASLVEWNHRPVWNLERPFRIGELLACVRDALRYISHAPLFSGNIQLQSGQNP